MRLIKMFGLTAIAAVAAMAFIGASSASATSTALCTSDASLVCAAGNVYTGHIEGLAVNPELLSSITNVTCEHSVILGNALGLVTGGSQVTHLELIDFTGNCKTSSGTACTVTTTALGLVDLLKTAPNLGTATSLNSKVKVVCGFFINCTFGGTPELHVVGSTLPLNTTSSLGALTANKASLSREGGICPSTSEWDAKYTIQLPHELFVTE